MADGAAWLHAAGPCGCEFCRAERWLLAAHGDPSTPAVARAALGVMLLELAERRAAAAASRPLTRRARVRRAVGAWWARQVGAARDALGWMGGEPAVVIAASVWASLWCWGSIAWALVVGGWSLRGLAALAGVGFFVANAAGARRIRDAEGGD